MLQNARVTAFTVSELLKENQHGVGIKLPPALPAFPTLQIKVNDLNQAIIFSIRVHHFADNTNLLIVCR